MCWFAFLEQGRVCMSCTYKAIPMKDSSGIGDLLGKCMCMHNILIGMYFVIIMVWFSLNLT